VYNTEEKFPSAFISQQKYDFTAKQTASALMYVKECCKGLDRSCNYWHAS